MGDAARSPEAYRLPPLGLGADPDRGPGINADAGRIASRRLGHRAQLVESGDHIIAWRIIQRHPTIAPFDNALHRHVGMAAEPDRDPAACRQWIDPGILGRLREFAYGGWIAPNGNIDKGQRDAKFHLDFPRYEVAQPV